MSAMWSAMTQPAMFAGTDRAKRMPFFMHPMCMATAATASIIIIGTGVNVGFFICVLAHRRPLLLVSLLVLIGLILSGLTGLVLVVW